MQVLYKINTRNNVKCVVYKQITYLKIKNIKMSYGFSPLKIYVHPCKKHKHCSKYISTQMALEDPGISQILKRHYATYVQLLK